MYSRRRFIQSAAVVSAIPALSTQVQAKVKEVPELDVLVVGAGFAGLTTAVVAARSGASVRIIDKRVWFGGDGVLSSGIISATGTKYQKASDIKDDVSIEAFRRFWVGGNATSADGSCTKNNPQVLDATTAISHEVIEFISSFGVEFRPVNPAKPFQHSSPRGSMSKFVNGMIAELKSKGVNVEGSTRATDLIVDKEGVCGVKILDKNRVEGEIYAKNVILATGGYLDNEYIYKRWKSFWSKVPSAIGSYGEKRPLDRTGDGILMGKKIGAALDDMEATPCLNARTPVGIPFISWTMFDVEPAYLVTKNGNRIVDENRVRYMGCCLELLKRGEKVGFAIFGEDTFSGPNKGRFKFKEVLEKKGLFKGDTPEELAAKVGIDPVGLRRTIERINKDAQSGRDSEFGRTGVFKALRAPYYATAAAYPIQFGTEGGLEVNPSFEVLRHVDDKPIPGLYAVGTTSGSITLHLNDVIASGLIAGRSVGMSLGKS